MSCRRDLLFLLGTISLAPRKLLAQSTPVVIGWLHASSRELAKDTLEPFKEGLAVLGWKEGLNFEIEQRWADGREDRLKPLAEELAAKRPAVIVAAPLRSVVAASKAAPKTPIVIGSGDDPVAAGLVKGLARPGGMITGTTNFVSNLSEKLVELLLAAAPGVRRVGFLADSNNVNRTAIREAARRSAAGYSAQALFAEVASADEIEKGISDLRKQGAQALVVLPSVWSAAERGHIAKLALAQRWPAVAGLRAFVEEGLMMSYGVDSSFNYRRAAYYVDKILKGARPGELPIEQPTKIEMAVNMKTAKALGIKIPQSILVRADRVIE